MNALRNACPHDEKFEIFETQGADFTFYTLHQATKGIQTALGHILDAVTILLLLNYAPSLRYLSKLLGSD